MTSAQPDRHFELKGKRAEEVVRGLAEKTFLSDWCYPNPKLPNNNELCDLLVVFDEIVIIFQVKELKARKEGGYNESETEKNLRQLSGAKRQLFDIKAPIELENPRRGREKFEAGKAKEIYLVSILMGEAEGSFSLSEELKTHTAHVMTGDFVEILFRELDTISDFVEYIRTKEKLFEGVERLVIMGGEEELLSFYLANNRSFERLHDAPVVMFDEGSWNAFVDKPEYKRKKEVDEISYLWDEMIDRAHEFGEPRYEAVARELARLDRLQRRMASKAFFEAQANAHKDEAHDMYRRKFLSEAITGTTFCFLFMDAPESGEGRQKRISLLCWMCWIARGQHRENKKVLGIATEKKILPTCSYDYCLYDIPEWTEDYQKRADDMQKKTDIFKSPSISWAREQEYPSS